MCDVTVLAPVCVSSCDRVQPCFNLDFMLPFFPLAHSGLLHPLLLFVSILFCPATLSNCYIWSPSKVVFPILTLNISDNSHSNHVTDFHTGHYTDRL